MCTSRFRRRRIGVIATVLALSTLMLSGCGSDASSAGAASTTTAAAPTTQPPPGTVNVTLADLSATSMSLVPSTKSEAAGSITFVVKNTGDREHEFVVMRTDIAAADLPIESTDRVDEEGPGIVNVGEIGSVKQGETATLVLDLEPGHYALVCNLVGHVRMGMVADFDVT